MQADNGPKHIDREFSAVTSGGSDDKVAKSFVSDNTRCSIYIFKEFDFFQLPYPPAVTLGSLSDEPVPARGYLFVKLPPGTHRLQVSDQYIDFACSAGELLFYAVSNRGFVTEPRAEIEQVTEQRGKKEVEDRKILVTW